MTIEPGQSTPLTARVDLNSYTEPGTRVSLLLFTNVAEQPRINLALVGIRKPE